MINRETSLAKIIGQMSLSKSKDVSIQSWVFISVKNMILHWQGGYIHINGGNYWRVMSGNNVVEGDANNRSDVYT